MKRKINQSQPTTTRDVRNNQQWHKKTYYYRSTEQTVKDREAIPEDPNQTSRCEKHIWHENTLDGINSILDIVEVKKIVNLKT